MNLKELIFGEGVHTGGSGVVYRDSVQAWLPIKNIIGGVVITKDNRFVKIMEVLPVNIYLKSAIDRQNIKLNLSEDEVRQITRFRRGEGLLCIGYNHVPIAFHTTPKEYEAITTSPTDLRVKRTGQIDE